MAMQDVLPDRRNGRAGNPPGAYRSGGLNKGARRSAPFSSVTGTLCRAARCAETRPPQSATTCSRAQSSQHTPMGIPVPRTCAAPGCGAIQGYSCSSSGSSSGVNFSAAECFTKPLPDAPQVCMHPPSAAPACKLYSAAARAARPCAPARTTLLPPPLLPCPCACSCGPAACSTKGIPCTPSSETCRTERASAAAAAITHPPLPRWPPSARSRDRASEHGGLLNRPLTNDAENAPRYPCILHVACTHACRMLLHPPIHSEPRSFTHIAAFPLLPVCCPSPSHAPPD